MPGPATVTPPYGVTSKVTGVDARGPMRWHCDIAPEPGRIHPVDIAQLVLEYLKVLRWPVLILGVLIGFRGGLSKKLNELKSAEGPGVKAAFEERAKAVEAAAEEVAEHQRAAAQESLQLPSAQDAGENEEPRPENQGHRPADSITAPTAQAPSPAEEVGAGDAPAERGELRIGKKGRPESPGSTSVPARETADQLHAIWLALESLRTKPSEFEEARNLVSVSADAAVIMAYKGLERTARAAWTARSLGDRSHANPVVDVVARLDLGSDSRKVARELAQLRNEFVHAESKNSLSVVGVHNYIDACESLAEAIASKAGLEMRDSGRDAVLHARFGRPTFG